MGRQNLESKKLGPQKPKDPSTNGLVFDPILQSLFATSAGPVQFADKGLSKTQTDLAENGLSIRSSVPQAGSERVDLPLSQIPENEKIFELLEDRPRKRRKIDLDEDLERRYLDKLVKDEEKENTRLPKTESTPREETLPDFEEDNQSDTSASNDLLDLSDSDEDVAEPIPVHESLTGQNDKINRTNRTIFISNVCTSAIKSKTARKTLIAHLKGAMSIKDNEKIESIRFRSTAFAADAGPKKAAFAKKELMDQTTRNTNAYAVLSSEAAARRVALKLNGSVVLDRHIHVDSLAHPLHTDNRRCVFVGNLPFVDEETVAQESGSEGDSGGQSQKRSKAKAPADAEEGLWRTFSKCGKVESVRVVRDKATRVGKGFAYVQFEDGNGVEKALQLDGKKFPPLLPRLLRISRAKGMKRKEVRARAELRGSKVQKSRAKQGTKAIDGTSGRKGKLNGVVFEGYRASSDNKMKFKTKGKAGGKKDKSKPTSRSSKRGAAFKAGGGKKKRDVTK